MASPQKVATQVGQDRDVLLLVLTPACHLRCSLRLSFLVKIFPQRPHPNMVLASPAQSVSWTCSCQEVLSLLITPHPEQITGWEVELLTKVWAYR